MLHMSKSSKQSNRLSLSLEYTQATKFFRYIIFEFAMNWLDDSFSDYCSSAAHHCVCLYIVSNEHTFDEHSTFDYRSSGFAQCV